MKRLVRHEGELLAAAIQGAMSESLAIGDSDAVKQQFETLKENAPDVDVFVFDYRGVVSFATNAVRVGDEIKHVTATREVLNAVTLTLNHESRQKASFEEQVDGAAYLTVVQSIYNAPRCHHCHGSSREVLGGIMVRASTEGASRAIRTARNVNSTVTTIAAAVEQQAAVTDEIAASIAHSSQGVRQATMDVSRISEGLNDIGTDMSEVNVVAAAVSEGSVKISKRAEDLSNLAAQMNLLIARFQI